MANVNIIKAAVWEDRADLERQRSESSVTFLYEYKGALSGPLTKTCKNAVAVEKHQKVEEMHILWNVWTMAFSARKIVKIRENSVTVSVSRAQANTAACNGVFWCEHEEILIRKPTDRIDGQIGNKRFSLASDVLLKQTRQTLIFSGFL